MSGCKGSRIWTVTVYGNATRSMSVREKEVWFTRSTGPLSSTNVVEKSTLVGPFNVSWGAKSLTGWRMIRKNDGTQLKASSCTVKDRRYSLTIGSENGSTRTREFRNCSYTSTDCAPSIVKALEVKL